MQIINMKILIRNHHTKKWDIVESVDFSAEKELQKLLAETPSLISINEIRENASPLLVGVREVGLPGSGYTDLLAFNADGDIAVVECKLAANVEIKRKVIAQVLEYGAYLWGMTYDELNNLVYQRMNKDLAALVGDASGDEGWDEEQFRLNIQDNLTNGAFILVIAVDEMNDELTRTIRFLNACGNPSFAFTALEMQSYHKDETDILVPHLIGAVSTPKSLGGKHKHWTEALFFEAAKAALSPEILGLLEDLYGWIKENADRSTFGSGIEKGSFTFYYSINGETKSVFSIYTNGTLTLNYEVFSPKIEPEVMQWFHQGMITIPGFKNIPADFVRWPTIKFSEAFLNKPADLERFKNLVKELGTRIHK